MVDWAGQRVLVTGATGFIGRRLARCLVETQAQVWAGVAPEEKPERAAVLPAPARQQVFDLRDARAVQAAVAESAPQVIFHLAAVGVTGPGINPGLALTVNTGGTLHLLEALKGRDVQRVVLVGTCHEYGAREAVEGLDPFNAYAASKVAAWAFGRMYWRAYDLPVVVVRPFQAYGPGQFVRALVPAAIRAALAGEDFPMTLGEQQRDFVYVDDIVAGMLAAAAVTGIEGESLDLGTGKVHAVHEVVERVWAMTEAKGRILVGALPYRPGAVMCLVASADRTARLTGWQAQIGLDEGLRRTIDWTREVGDG
jgi:UDP-glucose 4-epimerase